MATLLDLTTSPPPKTVTAGTSVSALRTQAWKVSWTSSYASTAITSSDFKTLFTFANNDNAALYMAAYSGTVRLELTDNGATLGLAQGLTFSSGQTMTFTVDPIGNQITIAGATTGNGTFATGLTLANWFPTGQDLRIGAAYAAGFDSGGTYGNILDLSLTVAPTGLSSAEAFGSHSLTVGAVISPTGIASAEAFGTTVVSGALTIAPTGIASAEAFGSHTLAAGRVITVTGIASAEAVGSHTLSSGQSIAPTGIASAEAFGSDKIVQGVAPAGLSSAEAFGVAKMGQVVKASTIPTDIVFVVHGNSLVAAGSPAWPSVLATARQLDTVFARSVGGAFTSDLTSEFVAQIKNVYYVSGKRNIVCLHELLDSIHDDPAIDTPNVSTATAISRVLSHIASYISVATANGYEVLICTIADCTEFSGNPLYKAAREGVNAALRASLPSGALGLLDFGAEPALQDATNGTYWTGDGIHWNTAGAAVAGARANTDIDHAVLVSNGIPTAEAFGSDKIVQGIAPTGIASAEAFGSDTVTAAGVVAPTGIASAEAFGAAVVAAGRIVTVTGIASAEAFGAAVVAVLSVSPTGLSSAEAFGSHSLTAGAVVSPTGIASAEVFGATAVGSVGTIAPAGIASAEAFGAAVVTAGYVVAPAGVASAEAFGADQVSLTVAPTGIASAAAFGTTVVSGALTIAPTGIASAEQHGLGTISHGISLAGIASAEAFGATAVTQPGTIAVTGIASNENFGALAVAASALIALTSGIASAEAHGASVLSHGITGTGIASAEAVGVPSVGVAGGALVVQGIASAEAFGVLSIVANVLVAPTGIASAEAFGSHAIGDFHTPNGIPSEEAFGVPVVRAGLLVLGAGAIPSAEAFGLPTVFDGVLRPLSIPSAAAFGIPTITGGVANVRPAVVYSTAVIEVAGTRASGLPQRAETQLILEKGKRVLLTYQVAYSNGQKVRLYGAGVSLVLAVARTGSSSPVRVTANKRPDLDSNVAEFDLNAAFWSRFTPGTYRYSVYLLSGSEKLEAVPYSYFKVTPGF